MQFIPLVVIMVAMWALLIVPQQRRTKSHRQMLTALDVGDEVLTSAGIYGTIAEFDGDTVFLAVNDALEIKITKASISERIQYADADAE
jgi:preprotein translocase subunit YajC